MTHSLEFIGDEFDDRDVRNRVCGIAGYRDVISQDLLRVVLSSEAALERLS